MSEFDFIEYEIERGRVRITLNRPDKLNALSLSLLQELNEAIWEADNNRDVHCIIIRGAGRAFSAGYDLASGDHRKPVSRLHSDNNNYRGASSLDDDAWQMERSQRMMSAIFDLHKPVIAQIHGYCLAGGTDLALYCDQLIVADDATIGFPPARDLGALPNNMWIYHVGPQWAKRLTMTGDTINGTEAQQIGFAMKSVPPHLLEAEVEQLADRFAMIDPDLLTVNKRIINLGMELMGARSLQRLALENDVRGHNTRAGLGFRDSVRDNGLRETLRARDAKFGDGRARVNGPETRDGEGKLIDPQS